MLKDKHLILHIGMPKTGTSAIQKCLFVNRDKFLKQGLYIPQAGTQEEALTSAHHELATCLYMTEGDLSIWGTLTEEIDQRIESKILISSESFFNCFAIEQVQRIREFFPGKITGIMYLRKPDIFIHALYMQYIRSDASTTLFNTFIKKHTPDRFKTKIDLWEKFLGFDNFTIRPYEKQQWYNKNLMDDFLEHIDIRATHLEIPEMNPCWVSLNPVCVEILRYVNEKYKDDSSKLDFIRSEINNFNLYTKTKGYSFYTKEQRDEMVASFQPLCSSIAKTYLGRDDGKMFFDDPEEILFTLNQDYSQIYLDFFYSILQNSQIIAH